MIHLVTRENAAGYTGLLEEMFLWRHRIYVEQRGWKEIARPDGREIDQFDTEDAIYLIALDEEGAFAGSVRYVPTHKPTLFSEIYPHLIIRGEIPRSPSVWEMTRIFVIPSKRHELGRSPYLEELFIGSMEWAVKTGIEALLGLGEVFWLPRLLKMGWVVNPMGLPTLIEGEFWVPMHFETSAAILASTQQSFQCPNTTVFANLPDLKIAS